MKEKKEVLLMTHLPISPIVNAAELMTPLEIQGCLDDSPSDYYIQVASKRLLFHKQNASFPQGVSEVDDQNPALNHSQNVTKVQEVKLVTQQVMSPGSTGSEDL